jgi:hypothetical protein
VTGAVNGSRIAALATGMALALVSFVHVSTNFKPSKEKAKKKSDGFIF